MQVVLYNGCKMVALVVIVLSEQKENDFCILIDRHPFHGLFSR